MPNIRGLLIPSKAEWLSDIVEVQGSLTDLLQCEYVTVRASPKDDDIMAYYNEISSNSGLPFNNIAYKICNLKMYGHVLIYRRDETKFISLLTSNNYWL